MSRHVEDLLPPEESLRLVECVKEPVHVPGSIQPHGVLLALDPDTLQVVHASANTGELLGVDVDDLVGRRLIPSEQHPPIDRLQSALAPLLTAAALQDPSNPTRVETDGSFDAIVHRSGDLVIVELEPWAGWDTQLLPRLHAVLARLSAVTEPRKLLQAAADEIAGSTGFERVMVYEFHPDGHGEIVAESRVADMDPYLGLHYPATDVPAQVRQLYLRQPSRTIVASDHLPSPLRSAAQVDSREPLDLSLAELRGVSPHHVEFMRNMGITSSFSLALIRDGALAGMISCNHRQRRHLPYLLRRGCEIVAAQVALQWGALVETQHLTRRLDLQGIRARLVNQISGDDDVRDGLLRERVTVLDLLTADGAAVCRQRQLCALGDTPDTDALFALGEMVRSGDRALVTDMLAEDRPDVAALIPGFAGLVMIPFGTDGDYLAWFRREVLQSVSWLGDQNPANRPTPLSPRSSFDRWSQEVTGRCLPWEDIEVAEARQLCPDIDVVLLRRAEEQLAHLGLHDALTGLPNRRLLMDRLDHALERHSRGAQVALLFVDLDRFKLINDTYGHEIGDAAIVKATRLISGVVRAVDTVARLGGDEFVVICVDTDANAARMVVDRIIRAFNEPLDVGGRTLRLTVSIGLTVADGHRRAADLLREADIAMYLAKADGRNRASRFEPGLRHQAVTKLDTEQALRQGLDRGEFVLHYQPIQRLQDGSLHGVEALIRWNRPGQGVVGPSDFITLAEENGFIVALGEWVLGEALSQLSRWRRLGLVDDDFTMAVNMSPRQLMDPGLVHKIRRGLEDNGLRASDLVLEITESTLMSERSMMADTVNALAEAGLSLSVDDFGTGYSSLAYLLYLPVVELKVDRSFVAALDAGSAKAALVSAVIGLAHDLGMRCVAEGVETDSQLAQLRTLGCDFAQGFLIGHPQPVDALTSRWSTGSGSAASRGITPRRSAD